MKAFYIQEQHCGFLLGRSTWRALIILPWCTPHYIRQCLYLEYFSLHHIPSTVLECSNMVLEWLVVLAWLLFHQGIRHASTVYQCSPAEWHFLSLYLSMRRIALGDHSRYILCHCSQLPSCFLKRRLQIHLDNEESTMVYITHSTFPGKVQWQIGQEMSWYA